MAFSLIEPLVIGISSRALFDLEEENRIYEREGLAAYEAYQLQHENDVLRPGAAFPLVQAFLALNQLQAEQLVEVIIMSRNSPNTSLRIFRSVQEYGLDISRAALSGGGEIAPYLKSYETDLFLSANAADVQQAIDAGVAAGVILPGNLPDNPRRRLDQIRIAFDGDAVLFAADSERIFQREGIDAFFENEQTLADVPLREGPFAPFLRTLAHIQSLFADREEAPIRTALVTSRNAPAHERPIKTLRHWGVRVDEAHFLGGAPKAPVLKAFGAHIFFDDQPRHAMPAAEVVPAAVVPYPEGEDPMN